MVEIAREFARHATVPIVIQSNAGLPEQRCGVLVWPESPAFMAERVGELIDLGVKIIGGCCGTGPDHICAIRSAVDARR
jgi:5-methyltetrahydrofolate--homocysteine methyltransferase